MKLSHRLQKIEQMVRPGYTHIWDCCCDHGLLGAALLARQTGENVHFVDVVPELMNELEKKLHRFHKESTWATHCIDAAKIPLQQYSGSQLIIIAGVGGDLISQLVKEIYQKHPTLPVDFLLCPVHHQYSLRQQLVALNFSLKKEILIEDKNRFYEILLVSSKNDKNKKITPTGEDIWKYHSENQSKISKNYLQKKMSHYQRIQKGRVEYVENIIEDYSKIEL